MLDMLEKTSLSCIRSVLSALYVLKPAKRADFSMIGRFVNFLMWKAFGEGGGTRPKFGVVGGTLGVLSRF